MEPVNYNNISQYKRRKVREAYVKEQDGMCYYCKSSLTSPVPKHIDRPIKWELFPTGFLNNPVHLHHSHKTGMTIGAVHAKCNAILWQYYGE